MAASPTPIVFAGQLQLPADASLPPDPIPFNATISALSQQPNQVLNLSGTGTVAVPFGTVGAPGAKLVAVRYDSQGTTAQPVLLKLNGSTVAIELSPGGFILLMSPTPAAGITSLSIDYTADCQLKVWIAG